MFDAVRIRISLKGVKQNKILTQNIAKNKFLKTEFNVPTGKL
jgi:hypothetical protein